MGSFWILSPALVPYYLACGLNATQTFVIQAAFSAAICVLEIPTGYVSDMWGRRLPMIVSSALLPIGIAIYIFAPHYAAFIVAEVFFALYYCLRSGTDTAILYDTLRELGREKEHKKIEGTRYFISQISTAIANMAGGALGKISLTFPFYARMASAAPMMLVALTLKEPSRTARTRKPLAAYAQDMFEAVRYAASHKTIRTVAVYSAAINGTGLVGMWSYYLFYTQLGMNIFEMGILSALFYVLCGIGGKLAHRIERKIGERATLCLPALIGPSFLAAGTLGNMYAVPMILLNGFLWGLFIPLKLDIVHRNTPMKRRATTLSAISVGERLVFVALSIAAGRIADASGLNATFFLTGTIFLACSSWALVGVVRAQDSAFEPSAQKAQK